MHTIPLIDNRVIAQVFGMRREVQHPRPLSDEPILTDVQAYGSVLRDRNGLWRMWYLGSPVYCEYYATSLDGIRWQRPDLDLVASNVRHDLNSPNAIMCRDQKDDRGRWLVGEYGPEGFCVLDSEQTPHPASKARFTALYLARTDTESGMYVAHSNDGMHWLADSGFPVIPGWRDTSSVLLFDPTRKRYIWYGRPEAYAAPEMHANRLIALRESPDLVNWTEDNTILDTDDADADPHSLLDESYMKQGRDQSAAGPRAAAWAELTEGKRSEQDKPLVRGRNRQWYGITAFQYSDLYLGIVWMYDLPTGDMWTELLHSFDGVDWRREAIRVPFIPRTPGTCTCTMASPPITVGDEIRIYYSLSDKTHHGVRNPSIRKGIRVATLPRDRWVGYVAGDVQGELLTQVMEAPSDLRLNAATERNGWVRVGVTDADGRPIQGLTQDECTPISGDAMDIRPAWQSGKTLESVTVPAIRFRISARRASIFALKTEREGDPEEA
jgi:hypothetical protein